MKITVIASAPLLRGDLVTSAGFPAIAPTDDIVGVAFEDTDPGEPCDVETAGKVRVRVGAGGAGLTAGQPVIASAADADGSAESADPAATIAGLALVGDSAFFAGVALESIPAGEEGYISLGVYTGSRQV